MRLRLGRPDGMKPSTWAVAHLLARRPRCPKDFALADFYRYGARIHELRRWGAVIGTEPCTDHNHWNGPQVRYVLEHVPGGWLLEGVTA